MDAHTHIFPPTVIADRAALAEREPWFGALYGGRARMADADALLSEMDRAGVERSLCFGFGWRGLKMHRRCNDYLVETAAGSGGRIRAGITVPVADADATIAELEYWRGAPVAAVGELYADGQGFDLANLHRSSPLPQACVDRDLILCIHVTEPAGHSYPGKDSTGPRQIASFLAGMPEGLRLQLPHWGAGFGIFESMPEIRARTGSVRYDCAASHLLYDDSIYGLMARIAPGRILFGSDYPLTSQRRMLRRVRRVGLEPGLEADFLGRSADGWGI
ncbi:MAG: amidohydrolase family protein [Chloroflexota bacterium]|nr:amidohydrolase family protein [Chloroflexota bacterium]